jgi:hypothetical protein
MTRRKTGLAFAGMMEVQRLFNPALRRPLPKE